jgi:hypothetical protein
MSTDITYCATFELCSVASKCKRAVEIININYPSPAKQSVGKFEPEKGKDCIGFKPKTKQTNK